MRLVSLFLVLSLFGPRFAEASTVANVKVTVLSTMLADRGIGEWGFAALVEADGRQLLIDTGARPNTVLQNARELGIDLSRVPVLVLTHFHDDHVGGLLTLRSELKQRDPTALSVVHVATGIFPASDAAIDWTADKLKKSGVRYLIGAHCTGIEAVYRLRKQMGLSRKTAVVGAVGASFSLADGIHPGEIAQ